MRSSQLQNITEKGSESKVQKWTLFLGKSSRRLNLGVGKNHCRGSRGDVDPENEKHGEG